MTDEHQDGRREKRELNAKWLEDHWWMILRMYKDKWIVVLNCEVVFASEEQGDAWRYVEENKAQLYAVVEYMQEGLSV